MSFQRLFESLAPLSWETDISPHLGNAAGDSSSSSSTTSPSSVALDNMLASTLVDAQLLIESIPTPTPQLRPEVLASPTSIARSHTDSNVPTSPPPFDDTTSASSSTGKAGTSTAVGRSAEETEMVENLRKEWKDLKMHQQSQGNGGKNKKKSKINNGNGGGSGSGNGNNPHQIAVYKMSAKDGKGAWFARRSLHRAGNGGDGRGGFEKWEAALRKEMEASLERVQATPGKEPGTGNIRGIGAERRVERVETEAGTMELFHVSARFPGPITPRDFVTLIMMPGKEKKEDGKPRRPRQFMLVSRPCEHPDCPPRNGFIRGTYESVELIREVPVEKPLLRARSSTDPGRSRTKEASEEERTNKETTLRTAKQAAEDEGEAGNRKTSLRIPDRAGVDAEMAIEWLMVTRSEPGGSVPRFMVEKGTPGGIINDASRFLDWLSSQTLEDLTKPRDETTAGGQGIKKSPAIQASGQPPADASVGGHLSGGEKRQEEAASNSNGVYGMLSSALAMASSVVASRVAAFAPPSLKVDDDYESSSSNVNFTSADESSASHNASFANKENITADDASARSSLDSAALSETGSQAPSNEPAPSAGLTKAQLNHEKELRKLQNRMRKAQEKLERTQARRRNKHGNGNDKPTDGENDAAGIQDKENDDQALAKLREKHEREIARQEEKFRRELQRLAEKRAAEERKAEARRRKAAEREEKVDLARKLERVQAERDVARKEAEILRERVGELQRQNTRLVARLGKEGVNVEELTKTAV
ncbi:hypothetical protein VTH82DRAFT_1101 [Thermothelomyces myriococcoides]